LVRYRLLLSLWCFTILVNYYFRISFKREKWSEFFGSRPIFRADKTPKIPFLGLSLLPNPTETLATQAREFRKVMSVAAMTVADVVSVFL